MSPTSLNEMVQKKFYMYVCICVYLHACVRVNREQILNQI